MADTAGLGARLRRIWRTKWVKPALLVGFIAVLFAIRFVPSADAGEIEERLAEKYGVSVQWHPESRYQRDTLVVDGQDVSEHCVVTGDWGPLDDLAIECDGTVSFVPVDQ